jgi:hypothetical protein
MRYAECLKYRCTAEDETFDDTIKKYPLLDRSTFPEAPHRL